MLYRPVGNAFLDECDVGAFWLSSNGLKNDFPNSKVKSYSEDEVETYFQEHSTDIKCIKIYK